MKPGEKRLVLQSPQPTIEDGPRSFPKELMEQKLQALNLTEYTQWEWVVVGPGITREQLVSQFEQSYRFFKAHDCPTPHTLKPLLTTSSTLDLPADTGCSLISGSELTEGEYRCKPPDRGFAIIQNLGPNTYPNNNGQSVILIAPSVGNNQEKWKCGEVCEGLICTPKWCGGYSAFLNNGMTDKHYFLQVGLYFTNRPDPLNPPHSGNPPIIPSDCVNLPEPDPGNPFSPEGIGYVVFAGAEEGGDLSSYAL
jgi:hypothetical protein